MNDKKETLAEGLRIPFTKARSYNELFGVRQPDGAFLSAKKLLLTMVKSYF